VKKLLNAISRFSRPQKLAVAALLLLIMLTWAAVCLVLTGYIGP
jgi:hypothetical protein